MKLAIVHDRTGTLKVHAPGCKDLAKVHAADITEEEWASREALVLDFFSDILDSDPLYDVEDALGWAVFKPCCKALPKETTK